MEIHKIKKCDYVFKSTAFSELLRFYYGEHNSGQHNSGEHKTGDHNSGDHNSGARRQTHETYLLTSV